MWVARWLAAPGWKLPRFALRFWGSESSGVTAHRFLSSGVNRVYRMEVRQRAECEALPCGMLQMLPEFNCRGSSYGGVRA